MKMVILCLLIISNSFFRIIAMPDLAKWTEDEIGERWVGRIRDILKDPLMTLLATSEFTTKKELKRRIASCQDVLKQFNDLVKEEMEPKSSTVSQVEKEPTTSTTPASVMPAVTTASPAQAPASMAMPAVISMASSMPEAAVAAPAQVQSATMATPTIAEELMPTAPTELIAPSIELMTMPIEAPEQQSAAIMSQNDPWTDDEPLESVAEKFDELAIAELDESALELMPLGDDESSIPAPRFVKDAMVEKMPKIQVIHDQDLMNSI